MGCAHRQAGGVRAQSDAESGAEPTNSGSSLHDHSCPVSPRRMRDGLVGDWQV